MAFNRDEIGARSLKNTVITFSLCISALSSLLYGIRTATVYMVNPNMYFSFDVFFFRLILLPNKS